MARDLIYYLSYYFLVIALIVVMILNLKLEYKANSIALLLWLPLLLVYAVPSIFDPFNAEAQVNQFGPIMDLRGNITLLRAHSFALFFSIIYYVVRKNTIDKELALLKKSYGFLHYPTIVYNMKYINLFVYFVMLFLLSALFLGILAIVINQGWRGLLDGTYASYRSESNTVLKLMGYYISVSVSGVLFLSWALKRRFIFFSVIIIIFSIFLLGRTRQLLIPATIPFMMYFIYKYSSWKSRFLLVLTGIFAYLFLLFLQIFRYQGGLVDGFQALASIEFYFSYWEAILELKGEAVRRLQYYFFMQPDINFPGFMEANTFTRLSLIFFPSALLEGIKPIDYDIILYNYYYGEGLDISATIHTLIFGSSYANLGWFGILLGAGWALFFHVLNIFILRSPIPLRILSISIVGYVTVMIARGSIYNSLAICVWSLIFIQIIYIIYNYILEIVIDFKKTSIGN